MISKNAKKYLSVVIGFVLVSGSSQILYGYQAPAAAPAADTGNPTEATQDVSASRAALS
jgi:hypothetical protein